MKILVIDDDIDILEMFNMLLKENGYECLTATTAADGIERFLIDTPDGVFLDIRLPDRNGLEVLKEIKKYNPNIPVVLTTAYKDAEKAINGLATGAFDCVLKPFNLDYIHNIISKMHKNKL